MRVAHLETGMHLYGGAQQVVYLLQGLQGYPGLENHLICPAGSAIASCRLPDGATIHEVAMAGEGDLAFPLKLLRLLRRIRPDILHIHSRRGADVWGGLAGRLAHGQVVLTRRVDNPEPALLARIKYGLFDRVIAISRGIREVLLSESVPEGRVVTVPSAVEASSFQRPCNWGWFCEEFGLEEDSRALGMVAQFIERKGHDRLVEAMPAILDACPRARFLLFGQGPLEEPVRDALRQKGLLEHAVLAGFRSDLDRVLPCLDLLIHPASMEGLGVSLLQAAAAGIPIVATRVGGIPEIVDHGRTGLLVEPGDAGALAESVIALLMDGRRAGELAQAARRRAREHFSVESMVRGNLQVYWELMENHG